MALTHLRNCRNGNELSLVEIMREMGWEPKEARRAIRCVLAAIRIWMLAIYGGESFIYEDLGKILDVVINEKRIRAVTLVTNGTVVPNDGVLKKLGNKKIKVSISAYDQASDSRKRLIQALSDNKVNYYVADNLKWVKRGSVTKRGRRAEQLADFFFRCKLYWSQCNTLFNGKIYHCDVYANGVNLGLIAEQKGEVLDVRNTPKKQFSKALRRFYARKYIAACDYCGEIEPSEGNTVPPAEQM